LAALEHVSANAHDFFDALGATRGDLSFCETNDFVG
jgi:hypothetical protein